ncbi:UPF0175 family protein [Haloferax larsenii]|uniref:Uncharacterized protein family (UPF0175) n=1 Tax=Haloferax larsenii TaxID=302484 RepID=A0A1H7KIY7_HALLR|nr:UPF0175 family protein [Haloferax larsenii]SEK86484.1 Uncharacterised protein family (UPF0175) [Haloferax larsenii]
MSSRNRQNGGGGDNPRLNAAERIFLLLLKVQDREPVPGNLFAQKEAFLIAKNLGPLEEYFDFDPHLQGPYSEVVESTIDDLRFRGYVGKSGKEIELTQKGNAIAEDIIDQADSDVFSLVEDVKNLANDLTKDELLVYIYYTYPQMTTKSWEKSDLEPKRREIAAKLYNKSKVSLSKGADLAGMDLIDFRRYISGADNN